MGMNIKPTAKVVWQYIIAVIVMCVYVTTVPAFRERLFWTIAIIAIVVTWNNLLTGY
jgi:hypothetical protein